MYKYGHIIHSYHPNTTEIYLYLNISIFVYIPILKFKKIYINKKFGGKKKKAKLP